MNNIITPLVVNCTVERKINSYFNAKLLILKDDKHKFKELQLEDYLKIPTPAGYELFRIKYIDDTAKYSVEVYCKHIFFDLENRMIWDTFIQQRNGQQALQQILNNLDEPTPFTCFSNMTNLENLRIVRTKGVSAILGGGSKENNVITRYGGEIDVNNYNIKLLKRLGADRGYQIREGKNLTDFNYKEDTTELCTRLLPVMFDGVTLPERYVDSPLINEYPQIYSKMVKFEDIKLKDSNKSSEDEEEGFNTLEEMYAECRNRCKEVFETQRIDRVRVNVKVNFIDIKKTEQYKHLEFLNRIDLGDTVEFILESYNVTAKERVIGYTYNSLLEDYEEIEIGRESDSIFNSIDSIESKIENFIPNSANLSGKFDEWYDKVLKDVTSQIHNGMEDSHVVVRENEILIMDTTDIATANKVWRFNRGGLGFSSTGYNGTYSTALTSNGQFVINEITCTSFIGNLIEVGTLHADRLSVEAKKALRDGLVTQVNFDTSIEGITQKVASTESIVTTHTNSINAVDGKINTAKNQAITDSRKVIDTRHNNENPQWYFTNYPRQTINEFKNSSIIQIPGENKYGILETKVPWTDSSGGYPVQVFRSNTKASYERKGTSNTSWGKWIQIEDIEGSQNKADQALNTGKDYTNSEVNKVVVSTNTKFSEINVTTDAIAQKVSQIENTTTTINGKVNAQETRLAAAEQKITPTAIINTVQSTINNTVANQQSYNNLVRNGGFEYGQSNWSLNNNATINTEQTWNKYSDKTAIVYCTGNSSGIYQRINNFEIGEWYTCSFMFLTDNPAPVIANVGIESRNLIECYWLEGFKKYSFQFKATHIEHVFVAYGRGTGNFFIDNIIITKGELVVPFIPNFLDIQENSINNENRISIAEQKITPTAIISTVQNTINQAQNNAVNIANSATDGKLNNYTPKNQFTEFKQTSENFQANILKQGYNNLILNGGFESYERNWHCNGGSTLNAHQTWVNYNGGNTGLVYCKGRSSGIFQKIKTEVGNLYTCSFLLLTDAPNPVVADIGIEGLYAIECYWLEGFKRYSFQFRATKAEHTFIAYGRSHGNFYIDEIMITEGSLVVPYTQNVNSVQSNNMVVDVNGLECRFEDNSYTSMGRDGFKYWRNGMSKPYQYITFNTKISRVRNGHWVNVILPEMFHWKYLHDFTVTAWAGAVNSDDFAEKQKDAIRNLFIEIGGWNPDTRELAVKPCLQKIGVATHTHWGWDSATTTNGNAIGEGSVDIIINVQM